MEKRLNDCYERIYKLCKETIPIEWTEVKIWAEKYSEENEAQDGEYWDYHCLLVYKDMQEKWHRGPEIGQEFSKEIELYYINNSPTKVVKDINKIFSEEGMERFKVFIYTVNAEGHFEVNFQYEYSRGETYLERLILWEYETTGFTGANFHKNIIKRYHPDANI